MRKLKLVLLIVASSLGLFIYDFSYSQEVEGETNQTPRDYILRQLGLDGTNSLNVSGDVAPAPKKQANTPLAPFYLSAQDYLALRDSQLAQTILYYDVRRGPVSGFNLTSVLDAVQKVQITLGEDFAAVKTGDNLKIYDFKFNRLLTVKPESKSPGSKSPGSKSNVPPQADKLVFDNISLYAKAYRNMNTVRRITRNGSLKTLPMGEGKSLDAFWIESSMSWAASAPDTALVIKPERQFLSAERKNQLVFKAKFAEEKYASKAFRDTLLALAHHEWPMHPQILQALYAYNAPPKHLEMLTYSPNALKGQKQTWVLTKQTHNEAVFPLPEKALGVAQRQETPPLVYVISEAAHNRALGGVQSLETLKQQFNQQIEAGKVWQAWITGQQYAAYSGKCDVRGAKGARGAVICQALMGIEAEQMSEQPERIQDYFTAVRAAGRDGLKAEAIKVVRPYLDEKDTPAFIVRIAAMARARMKPAQVKAAGLNKIDAETLLKKALAKDPYDPKTYVGLAQVLAAKGAYEQSWDIYDALRAGIPTAQAVELKINRVEKNLRKSTPGYFLDQ